MLIGHGVAPVDAQRYVTNLVKSNDQETTFHEVHGRGGRSNAAKRFRGLNCTGLKVMDLASQKPDGTSWDFSKKADKELAYRMQEQDNPE